MYGARTDWADGRTGDGAEEIADEAIRRYRRQMQILYVLPDYYESPNHDNRARAR
jgi:hypothetical protein